MTAPAFPDGIDAAVWEEVESGQAFLDHGPSDRMGVRYEGHDRYFVRREPTPLHLVIANAPDYRGPILDADQLAYVLSEKFDDASPLNLRRWQAQSADVFERVTRPFREATR